MGTHFEKKIECTDFQVDSVSNSCAGPKTILGRLFYPIRLVFSGSYCWNMRHVF